MRHRASSVPELSRRTRVGTTRRTAAEQCGHCSHRDARAQQWSPPSRPRTCRSPPEPNHARNHPPQKGDAQWLLPCVNRPACRRFGKRWREGAAGRGFDVWRRGGPGPRSRVAEAYVVITVRDAAREIGGVADAFRVEPGGALLAVNCHVVHREPDRALLFGSARPSLVSRPHACIPPAGHIAFDDLVHEPGASRGVNQSLVGQKTSTRSRRDDRGDGRRRNDGLRGSPPFPLRGGADPVGEN
jgi:hypothetical protein